MRFSAALLSLVLLGPGGGAAAQSAAGVVVSVEGPVAVHRGQGPLDVGIGFPLQPGDSLVVKQGGSCAGFSPTGETFHREGPSLIVFARLNEENFRSRLTKWVARQLAQWVGSSRNRPLIARGDTETWTAEAVAVALVSPGVDGAVRSMEPALMWKTTPGVDAYTVRITGEDGEEMVETTNGSEYRPSALTPGRRYAWKVSFTAGGRELSSSWREFRVLTADEEETLDAVLEDMPHLMAGVFLLSTGLHREALERFDRVDAGDTAGDVAVWRARALAGMGLYLEAYASMVEAVEGD
jgi:hypothetical protein